MNLRLRDVLNKIAKFQYMEPNRVDLICFCSKRVSDTHRDRGVYETMYTHCCFVVWITFRRKTFDVIKKEMGTILRSDTFNPAIRVKNAPVNGMDRTVRPVYGMAD